MKLRAQQILIPCISFGARARVVADKGMLTPIERVALEAIGAGLDDVTALTQVLGLGQRPVLDLIYDFWLKGYVVVDTTDARVRLAGDAAQAHQSGGWEQLATAENNLEVVPLIQELVSGAVLPHIGRQNPFGPDSSLVPTLRSGLSLEHVTRGELLDAVHREIERKSRRVERPLVAQEAWVEPDQLLLDASAGESIVQQRRFLPLLVDISRDGDSERLIFDVVDAPEVPPPVRKEIARNLSILADRLPDQLFFKRFREAFEKESAADVLSSTETALERLGGTVQGLEATDPGVLGQRHTQLVQLYKDAGFEVREKARIEAAVHAVAGYEEHEAVIRQLLIEAERQVVLGNPWVRLEALLKRLPGGNESWFDLIERALARGVQIFLMWGIQDDSKLDARVRNALMDLAARYRDQFLFAQRSSSLHAKFVIRDAHRALVTSYNFLDPPPHGDSLEVGLLVEGIARGVAPTAVLYLLEWARNAFPDYGLSRRMLLLPDELGAAEPDDPEVPLPPEMPDLATIQGAAAGASPAIRHWAQAWAAAYERLQALGLQYTRGVELVIDREHREALWEALRGARRRLALLSDKLSADVVTDRFARFLRARLEGGASCAIVYRREGASDIAEGPARRLHPLAQEYEGQFFLVEARSHAKVLVADDEVTIGSFNFLSYGGDYEGPAGQSERAEISLRVREPAAVEKVLAVLTRQWPDAFAQVAASSEAALEPTPELQVPPPLQPLFRLLRAARDPGEPLLRWFGATETPWQDLDALHHARVPEELLARAAGAAISRAADVEAEEARQWRGWLAEYLWRQTDFIGSALLLPSSARSSLGLEVWLAQLGAAVQAPSLPLASLPEASELRSSQAQAAALLLLVSVLEEGRFELLTTLESLDGLLPVHFRAWIRAAKTYCDQALQPLPMSLLRRSVGERQRREKIQQAREMFLRELESAENVGFRFTLGEHTWERLRSPGQFLGVMRSALEADDPTKLDRYITGLEQQGADVERVMDEASLAVRDSHDREITGHKRTACLKRLKAALKAARIWVELRGAPGVIAPDARVLSACWTLKRELANLERTRAGEVDPLAEPARRFVLTRLEPLFSAEEP